MQVFVTCPGFGLPAVSVTVGADSVVSDVLKAATDEWDVDPDIVGDWIVAWVICCYLWKYFINHSQQVYRYVLQFYLLRDEKLVFLSYNRLFVKHHGCRLGLNSATKKRSFF